MKNYIPKLVVVSCLLFSVAMLPASQIFGKNTKDNFNFVQRIEQIDSSLTEDNIPYIVLSNDILVVGEQSFLQLPVASAYRLVQKVKHENIDVSFYKAENNLVLIAVDDEKISYIEENSGNFANYFGQNEYSDSAARIITESVLGYVVEKVIDYVIEHEKEMHKRVDEARKKEIEAFNKYGRYSPEYVQAGKERMDAERNCLTCRNTMFDGKEHVGVGMHN